MDASPPRTTAPATVAEEKAAYSFPGGMSRTVERLIDLGAMLMLLSFCYLFRESQPALAGLVVGAAIQFWMQKNATAPDSPAHKEAAALIQAAAARTEAAATAAAEVLRTAERAVSARTAVGADRDER